MAKFMLTLQGTLTAQQLLTTFKKSITFQSGTWKNAKHVSFSNRHLWHSTGFFIAIWAMQVAATICCRWIHGWK